MIRYNTTIANKINFIECKEEKIEYRSKSIYICDEIEDINFIEEFGEDTVLVLLTDITVCKNSVNFITKYKNHSRIIRILKNKDKLNSIFEEQEDILVYTKNKENLEKLDKIDIQKELIHSKMNLKINTYTFMSEEMKDKVIKILINRRK